MRSVHRTPAVTSLPQSPQDEVDHRVRRYALTMGIRIACFLLMVLVTPYGWYTWVFALAAAVLPYIAVVFANSGSNNFEPMVESPAAELNASAAEPEIRTSESEIITIFEKHEDDQA